jgi:ATP-dependent DNA helicase RecQ
MDPFIKLLLRSYSGVFTEFVPVSERELARRAQLNEAEVRKNLAFLQKGGVLTYVAGSGKPQIIFITERLELKNLQFSGEHYHERKQRSIARIEAIREYVNSEDQCRSQILLGYFGEDNAPRCGRCDVCLERNKMNLNEMEFNTIRGNIRELLESSPKTLPELVFDTGAFGEDHVLLVIRWLVDKGAVTQDDQQRYHWRKQFRFRF